jgi:hypothetical protein
MWPVRYGSITMSRLWRRVVLRWRLTSAIEFPSFRSNRRCARIVH